MLCHSLAWRKQHGIDKLLSTHEPPPVIKKYYSGGWHYYDRGMPLYLELIAAVFCLTETPPNGKTYPQYATV